MPPDWRRASAGAILAARITATRAATARTLIIRFISYLLALLTSPGAKIALTVADQSTCGIGPMTYLWEFLDNFRKHLYRAARLIRGVGPKPFTTTVPLGRDITLALPAAPKSPSLRGLRSWTSVRSRDLSVQLVTPAMRKRTRRAKLEGRSWNRSQARSVRVNTGATADIVDTDVACTRTQPCERGAREETHGDRDGGRDLGVVRECEPVRGAH